MFIAIIIDGFSETEQDETNRVRDGTIQTFIDCWQTFDPKATGLIPVDELESLIVNLIKAELSLMPKGKKKEVDLLFNLHRDKNLVFFVK